MDFQKSCHQGCPTFGSCWGTSGVLRGLGVGVQMEFSREGRNVFALGREELKS